MKQVRSEQRCVQTNVMNDGKSNTPTITPFSNFLWQLIIVKFCRVSGVWNLIQKKLSNLRASGVSIITVFANILLNFDEPIAMEVGGKAMRIRFGASSNLHSHGCTAIHASHTFCNLKLLSNRKKYVHLIMGAQKSYFFLSSCQVH